MFIAPLTLNVAHKFYCVDSFTDTLIGLLHSAVIVVFPLGWELEQPEQQEDRVERHGISFCNFKMSYCLTMY